MDNTNQPEARKDYGLSSAERTKRRAWIKGRAATLLSHYWREDDDPALLAAVGKDWADVLEGIPQHILDLACKRYLREEPRRRPTPGAIYQMARVMMPAPHIVRDNARPQTAEERDAYIESVGRDKINPERKAQAEAILARFSKGESA